MVQRSGLNPSRRPSSKVGIPSLPAPPSHSDLTTGLREYWQSPYATYTQSRGRSRWRNQFLVDYLQRHGIQRTKKQVASHIQVLRNMWKGQPGPSP